MSHWSPSPKSRVQSSLKSSIFISATKNVNIVLQHRHLWTLALTPSGVIGPTSTLCPSIMNSSCCIKLVSLVVEQIEAHVRSVSGLTNFWPGSFIMAQTRKRQLLHLWAARSSPSRPIGRRLNIQHVCWLCERCCVCVCVSVRLGRYSGTPRVARGGGRD